MVGRRERCWWNRFLRTPVVERLVVEPEAAWREVRSGIFRVNEVLRGIMNVVVL